MKKVFVRPVVEKDTHKPDLESPPGVPRWVVVLAIMALVFLLVFAFFRFTGIAGDLSSTNDVRMLASIFLFTRVPGGQLL